MSIAETSKHDYVGHVHINFLCNNPPLKKNFYISNLDDKNFRKQWELLVEHILCDLEKSPFYTLYKPHFDVLLQQGPYKDFCSIYIEQRFNYIENSIVFNKDMNLVYDFKNNSI